MSQSPSQFDVSSVNGAQQYDCWRQHSSSLVWVRSVACLGFCRFHQCEKPGSRSIWSCILLPTLALYIRGTSETIARILQPYNILVAHKPITALLRLLNNVKDEDKPEDRQGAVYKIKCCDCQASYIGETGRNLSTRLTEHKRATRNGDVNNHIAEHHLKTKHQIDWDSATCITYSTDYYQRLTLESWFTNLEQTPLALNRSQQLPAPYKRLIDEIKQN